MVYNPSGDYAAVLVEGGTGGPVTYRVPVSHLTKYEDTGYDDGGSTGGGAGERTITGKTPIYESVGGVQKQIGWTIWYSDGTSETQSFAKGTLGTTSKIFRVNEEGLEAMVTPTGTVISAPDRGYGVIKNEYTERLTDFASDPLGFLSKTFSGYSGTYENNASSNETININGNLTLPNVVNGESFISSIRTLALQYTTRRR